MWRRRQRVRGGEGGTTKANDNERVLMNVR